MHERYTEVILDESFEGFRSTDSFLIPLEEVYHRLELQNLFFQGNFPIVENCIKHLVFDKHFGLVFTHDNTKYFYRTSKTEKNPDENPDDLSIFSLAPEEYVLNLGDCQTFFTALLGFQETVKQSSSPWVKHMSVTSVWERATYTDFISPVSFLHRITAEIQNEGLPFHTWTDIGPIIPKKETNRVQVIDRSSDETYIEGPRTLHIAVTSDSDQTPQSEEQIHSVVYGLDSKKEATIYSIILDPIDGITPGRVTAAKYNINLGIHILQSSYADFQIFNLDQFEEELQNNPEQLLHILDSLNTTILTSNNEYYQHLMSSMQKSLQTIIQAITTQPRIDTRYEHLRMYNNIAGGASMVSFMTTLALFRSYGIEQVRIPTHLPLIQHVKGKEKDDIYAGLTNSLVQRIQVLQSITSIPVPEEDPGSYVILDLRSWNINLSTVNKETRQIEPLLQAIQEM